MSTRHFIYAVLALLLAMAVQSPLKAQNMVPTLQEQVAGTWMIVSQYVEVDGQRVDTIGPNAKGSTIFDQSGHFVSVVQAANLPKFASNNRLTGTDAENTAVIHGSLAYYGTYTVNEKNNTITLHLEGSTFPNWDGVVQTRTVAISANRMNMDTKYTASSIGQGEVRLVYQRAK